PNEPFLVVVTARALMQRILDKDTLTACNFRLKMGEKVDLNQVAKKLAQLGYSREALVTLRGEFSIRGDIIDIFPSCGRPTRIELFDEEIESIRLFNIDNQRSVEEASEILIPPRWWVVLDAHDVLPESISRGQLVEKLKTVTDDQINWLPGEQAETLRSVMAN